MDSVKAAIVALAPQLSGLFLYYFGKQWLQNTRKQTVSIFNYGHFTDFQHWETNRLAPALLFSKMQTLD